MASKKEKAMKEKIEHLEDLCIRLSNRCFLKQEIQEQLSEHNLDEPTVLGLADDIYLLDEIRELGLK